jgi:outer membrane protein assembly factor BamB
VTARFLIGLVGLAAVSACLDAPSQRLTGIAIGDGRIERVLHTALPDPASSLQRMGLDDNRLYLDLMGGPILALDRQSGAELWRVERSFGAPSALLVDGSLVLYAKDTVFAVDAASGTPQWSTPLGVDASLSVPVIADGVLYVGAEKQLFALDVASGTELWQVEIGAGFAFRGVVRGVTVAGDTLYVTMEQYLDVNGAMARAHLLAVARSDGDEIWRFVDSTTWAKRGATFEPAVAANVVIVGDTRGHEYVAVDRATGALRYRLPNVDSYWAGPFEAPTIRGDTAFGGSGDGNVTAWDAATGAILWRSEAGGTISSIVPCGPFILAQDLATTALDRSTGEFLARDFHKKPSELGLLATRWTQRGDTVYVAGTDFLYGLRCTK